MAKIGQRRKNSGGNDSDNINNITKTSKRRRKSSVPRQSPQQRSSSYRGVTRHRWTGRYEAHLWDKNCWNQSHNKKGRQVYLGAYDDEATAAHAYDLAALKYWGQDTILNFPLSTYENDLLEMEGQSKEEYIGSLRRKSSGFSRGVSKYRGVARHHHNGRWEARIGRIFGNKYLYLGTYATQEEAATAYDMAAIEYRGLNAVTNFDLSRYIKWIRPNPPNPNGNHDDTQNPSPHLGLGLTNHHQESSSETTTGSVVRPSALGLLMLQSPKFKEMLKQITECSSPLSSSSSSSSADQPAQPAGQTKSSFPDDIQTSFEIQDSSSFVEEHGIVFGDYHSFSLPLFQCGLED